MKKMRRRALPPLAVPRQRSPFVDFSRKPRGGVHAGKRELLERLQIIELRLDRH